LSPLDRILRRKDKEAAQATVVAAPAGGPRSAPAPVTPGAGEKQIDSTEERELKVQRDRLIEKFTIMQTDLGGAFYEMAIRDHVRMDVLTAKAAELQQIDAELLAIEMMLELEDPQTEGLCSTCGTPFARGTLFCSQCGSQLNQSQAAAS